MESILGMVGGRPSKARAIVLRNNGIKNRYYALRNDKTTHTSAQMSAEAVRQLFDDKHDINKLEVLTGGTTSPDQLLPSLTAMTHGELGIHPVEIISATGACCSSMQGLKYAFMSVGSGQSEMAASFGTERFSTWMHASRFNDEIERLQELEENPFLAFEKEFLRWMLSDGSAAALLESKPNDEGFSFRIEWIESISYANELETCMYAGSVKNEDKSLTSWNEIAVADWTLESVFALKQDTRLLGANIVPKGGEYIKNVAEKRGLTSESIDHFLPHMSSEFFKKQIFEHMEANGIPVGWDKWFYNLPQVGNVGSASPFLMLEELLHSDRIKKGERILIMVPESARFSYAYIYLTVV